MLYQDQSYSSTVETDGVLTGEAVGMFQAAFLLDEADYLRFISPSANAVGFWAITIFSGVVGYAIGLLPKALSYFTGGVEFVTRLELFTVIGTLLLSACLFGWSKVRPSDYKDVRRRAELHFKSAPKQRQIHRPRNEE